MPDGEIAYSASTDGRPQYYIDTGTSCHFIEEIGALHDYVPFEVPRAITWLRPRTAPSMPSAQGHSSLTRPEMARR